MPLEYTGRGDPRRSMALLWGARPKPKRGPKPGLSVERIVGAALELADADGLDALSMRRVAERLHVGTMSLYTYVPSKAELMDLMLDAVLGELADALEARPPIATGWRDGLEARARADWELYERHPWMLHVATARSVLGPNEMRAYDMALATVADTGLRGREMVSVVTTVAMFVRGSARAAAEAVQAAAATGITDDEWWLARAPILEEKLAARRFPTIDAVAADGGFDEPPGTTNYVLQFILDDFEFGLQRVLDGIAAFIAARAAGDSA